MLCLISAANKKNNMFTANVLIFIFHFSALWMSEQTLWLYSGPALSHSTTAARLILKHLDGFCVIIRVCNSYCSCSITAFSFKAMSRNKIKHMYEPCRGVRWLIRHKECEPKVSFSGWVCFMHLKNKYIALGRDDLFLRFIFLGIHTQQTCWSKLYELFLSFHCVSHRGKGIRRRAAAVTPVTIRLSLDSCLDLWPHCPQTQKYLLWKGSVGTKSFCCCHCPKFISSVQCKSINLICG